MRSFGFTFITRKICCSQPNLSKMVDKYNYSYENALKTLQTTYNVTKDIEHFEPSVRLADTRSKVELCGISQSDLRSMSIIHVAGTKGKGSVSTACDAILSTQGLNTGLFTSPHLVSVRERIKVGRVPISESDFARLFFETYRAMHSDSATNQSFIKPHFFVLLVGMALKYFKECKVDVAIMEVGLGGLYDSTNIVDDPSVTIITRLDYDHMPKLGNSLEEIAFQKAGIIKQFVPLVTLSHCPPSVHGVIEETVKSKQASLHCIPPNEYEVDNPQRENFSLAKKACEIWLEKRNLKKDLMTECLSQFYWPGRYEVVPLSHERLAFVDGAHTPASLSKCCQWFSNKTRPDKHKTLIISLTGGRDLTGIGEYFAELNFDKVIFTPTIAYLPQPEEQKSLVPLENQLKSCLCLHSVWNEHFASPRSTSLVTCCIEDALSHVPCEGHVLITGSLHLVGSFFSCLQHQRGVAHLKPVF